MQSIFEEEYMSINRRSFLASGAAAGAVMTASGCASRSFHAEEKNGIRYRELGSTGFKVSEVGFGAMNTRDPELIHAAIDSGINYIDTAWKYMNGVNERVVGSVMETKRDKVFLTTKVTEEDLSKIPGNIEESLRRLKTDHVDLLLAHGLHETQWISNEDLIAPLVRAKEKGQARFIGFSTHKLPDDYREATLDVGVWEAVLVSYNFMSPPEVKRNIQKLREAGLAIIGMKTQARGDGNPDDATDSVSSQQAALRWVLEDRYVDVTIPGMTAFEHLAEDLAVMKMKYSFREADELRLAAEKLDKSYCRGVLGCDGCSGQCPNCVNVAEINRCLGYAYGYGDERLAWENYRELPASARVDACGECDECVVRCVNGLDIAGNIRRARRLFA